MNIIIIMKAAIVLIDGQRFVAGNTFDPRWVENISYRVRIFLTEPPT